MSTDTLMNIDEYRAMYEVERTHWWYRGLRKVLFYQVKKLNPKTILDAGCGTGINALELEKIGYEVYAFDASPVAVEFCKKRGLKNVTVGLSQNNPFKNKRFDLIMCMDVMVLLNENLVRKSMEGFDASLNDGGYLVINSATLQWLFSQHDAASNTYKRWSKKEMENFAEGAGFTIVKSTYRIFLLFPCVALVKLLAKRNVTTGRREELKGDLEKTSSLINFILFPIMWVENQILKFVNLPIGSSHFLIVRKQS